MKSDRPTGFTLIEVVAALAIVSIALLGLLRLHLLSINAADKAQGTTQAVFLAQEKMADVLSSGYPQVGVKSGIVETDDSQFTWRTEVTDARLPLPRRSNRSPARMRRLSVEVTWERGPGEKCIRLTTYVAENRIREA
ncbi:MAG: hypothetical protein A2Y76_09345 [Planctomycetes bacterium RBG_13_60_9]|nr:MAG: hypothetical protein A2Y76_09345 [Planctomycetes bacterium RBG_13_60_9]